MLSQYDHYLTTCSRSWSYTCSLTQPFGPSRAPLLDKKWPNGGWSLTVLFHSIGLPVRLGPDARGGHLTPQKWSVKASSDRPRRLSRISNRLSPRDKMNIRRPTHQPVKWSSTEYLAIVTRFRSHTKIIGKRNLFDLATIFTLLIAGSCAGRRGNL